jgi:hypothetical protein
LLRAAVLGLAFSGQQSVFFGWVDDAFCGQGFNDQISAFSGHRLETQK